MSCNFALPISAVLMHPDFQGIPLALAIKSKPNDRCLPFGTRFPKLSGILAVFCLAANPLLYIHNSCVVRVSVHNDSTAVEAGQL